MAPAGKVKKDGRTKVSPAGRAAASILILRLTQSKSHEIVREFPASRLMQTVQRPTLPTLFALLLGFRTHAHGQYVARDAPEHSWRDREVLASSNWCSRGGLLGGYRDWITALWKIGPGRRTYSGLPGSGSDRLDRATPAPGLLAGIIGQLLLPATDPAGFRPFCLVAIILAFALVPIALTQAVAPTQEGGGARISLKRLYQRSPFGLVVASLCGVTTSAFFALGPILAQRLGLDTRGVAVLMASGTLGGFLLASAYAKL